MFIHRLRHKGESIDQFFCSDKNSKFQKFFNVSTFRFRTLIRPYYRGAAGMIMVYDVTDEKTFDSIEEWMRCIAENTQECQIIQKVILANKTGWFKLDSL